ncbi:MAG: hypothetical protein ABH824_03545 [Nanoarchaeota archaeon]
MDVCIKNINDDDWRNFKSESVKHGLKLGDFFNKLVKEHHLRCKESNWENILYGKKKLKKVLMKEDAKKIRSEFRENFNMRM